MEIDPYGLGLIRLTNTASVGCEARGLQAVDWMEGFLSRGGPGMEERRLPELWEWAEYY